MKLQGHTDKRGPEAYNSKLGADRALAVKAELINLGVPESQLAAISFGESRPLFTENEEWAHAANRRVEVHLAEKKADKSSNKPAKPIAPSKSH